MLVVAAVIERDGRILIGQRKSTDPHPLKWEFPGGKVEPQETPEHALIRELAEELGIQATIGAELPGLRRSNSSASVRAARATRVLSSEVRIRMFVQCT